MARNTPLAPAEEIGRRIFLIRGKRVMLDSDLAVLYAVSTRRLNEQVRRNRKRFPSDFMFGLTRREFDNLMSQIATSSSGWGGRRKLSLAFTQEGVAMSGVLTSDRAVRVNVGIMRAFVKLRRMIDSQRGLARKLATLERKYDAQFRVVFDAIRELMVPSDAPKPRIGFKPKPE